MNRFTEGLPAALTLRVGRSRRFPLTGAMGAGNSWTVEVDGTGAAATVEIAPPPATAADPGHPPASSTAGETLVVTGTAPGTASVLLRLGRSWSAQTLAQHRIAVTVRP